MAVRICPECRHEIAGRQKYCMFCGCDLRKAKTVTLPETKEAKRDEGVWDPEESYRRASAARKLLLFFGLAALVAACAVLVFSVRTSSPGQGMPALRGGMSFEEASRAMEDSGYAPDGMPSEGYDAVSQLYQGREVYGCDTVYSILQVGRGTDGEVSLAHYYQEDIVSVGGESRRLRGLKKTMSNLYGDAEYGEGVYPYYWWPEENGGHFLYSTGDLVVAGGWVHN